MQLTYPKGSINPVNTPQGGADFHATPIPLDDASNVTMEYSVFMDANMDFVKGGKLPGLCGGHQVATGRCWRALPCTYESYWYRVRKVANKRRFSMLRKINSFQVFVKH